MPRHPPCALKNLTTKDQGVISREPQKPTTPQQHHPKGAVPSSAARSRFIFLEIASYKRCSRPLCSSQTTTPYHTPHTPTPATSRRSTAHRASQPGNQKHTSPTPRTHPQKEADTRHGPVVSGPNSVPNTTHQNLHRSVPGTPTPKGRCVFRTNHRQKPDRHLFVDIPPMSTRRRTNVCATGLLLTTPPHKPCGLAGLL